MQNYLSAAVSLAGIDLIKFVLMKMPEINDLSEPEILKKLRSLGEELLQLQIRKQTGQVEKPHLLKSLRRDRARLITRLKSINSTS